jgi:predicted transcriptional regulator
MRRAGITKIAITISLDAQLVKRVKEYCDRVAEKPSFSYVASTAIAKQIELLEEEERLRKPQAMY